MTISNYLGIKSRVFEYIQEFTDYNKKADQSWSVGQYELVWSFEKKEKKHKPKIEI